MSGEDDLDDLVRRTDPDRWLASRFVADPAARADLIALYAFNHELARAAEVASQPLIGEMRLAWWREALEEVVEGRPVRRHPVAQAMAEAIPRRALPREALEALVDARLRDLDPWPLGPDEAMPYVDATAGRLMALAARILSPGADPHDLAEAARAWGLSGLARLGGRLPADWTPAEARGRVEAALARARGALKRLPVAAFPAVAYAALAGPYVRGRSVGGLEARARLVWASLSGRI
ncbi:MAG: squalene/phytoene synthase family protein [Caulobacteraceae bacterium]